jgi:hypothetical protein
MGPKGTLSASRADDVHGQVRGVSRAWVAAGPCLCCVCRYLTGTATAVAVAVMLQRLLLLRRVR